MYHINNNGESRKCGAKTPSSCRFYQGENDSRHYESADEARIAAEDISRKMAEDSGAGSLGVTRDISNKKPGTLSVHDVLSLNCEFESESEREEALSHLNGMIEAGDMEGVRGFLDERRNDLRFLTALGNRDALRAHLDTLREKERIALGKEPDENGVTSVSMVKYRDAALEARPAWEAYSILNNTLDEYKGINAQAALAWSQMVEANQKADGTWIEYHADSLGDLVPGSEYASNTPEWHAERMGGVGGSDVGMITGADPRYAAANYRQVLSTKLGLPDERSAEMNEASKKFTTAIGRGNAWEEAIRHIYQEKHPEKSIAFCKTSWKGRGDQDFRRANFDGLELDKNGKPVGIVEIKTGVANPHKWGDTRDGYAGMPTGYRQQTLWYAHNAGLKNVTLVAMIDDNDYREYSFSLDDPRAQAEIADIEKRVNTFWKQDVPEARRQLDAGETPEALKVRRQRKGFNPNNMNRRQEAKLLAAYTGESIESASARVNEALRNVTIKSGKREADEVQKAMTKLYASHDPSKPRKSFPLEGIDIETNAISPSKGRIIETALVSLDHTGRTSTDFSSLHGLKKRAAKAYGVGEVSVHGITPEAIKDKKPFEDESVQKKVLGSLVGKTLVAHNADFEMRHLSVNLKGFAEAVDAGKIRVLDTRLIARNLMPKAEGTNSLETFVENNGIPYSHAHAAEKDTQMMMEGLDKFMKNLHKNGEHKTVRPTKASRIRSEKGEMR